MLAWSALVAGISILSLSTLSSSIIVAKEVLLQGDAQLQRYTAGQRIGNKTSPIKFKPRRDTYFQTISDYLFDASTSM